MLIKMLPLVTIFLALSLVSCRQEPPSASAGALPAMFVPVGPVPGYAKLPKAETNPYAHDHVAMTQGRKLFNWYNCSGCHGGHGGGGMGPSLRDQTWIYGSTDAEIFDSIAQGRGKGMPAWGLKIPEDQIWQLVAYIKSMRTPDEPDAPE
jgi:cytochrome c oxidase cbb3-type subunit III